MTFCRLYVSLTSSVAPVRLSVSPCELCAESVSVACRSSRQLWLPWLQSCDRVLIVTCPCRPVHPSMRARLSSRSVSEGPKRHVVDRQDQRDAAGRSVSVPYVEHRDRLQVLRHRGRFAHAVHRRAAAQRHACRTGRHEPWRLVAVRPPIDVLFQQRPRHLAVGRDLSVPAVTAAGQPHESQKNQPPNRAKAARVNLDAKLRVEIRAEIKRLHLAFGSTTVHVTHDQKEAITLAIAVVARLRGCRRRRCLRAGNGSYGLLGHLRVNPVQIAPVDEQVTDNHTSNTARNADVCIVMNGCQVAP